MPEDQQSLPVTCSQSGEHTDSSAGYCRAGQVLLPGTETATTARSDATTTSLSSSCAFVPGMLLGHHRRYRIERIIGKGGFSEAYLATDTQLERRCLVKRLVAATTAGPHHRRRLSDNFQHEARLLASLNTPGHPSIPEIYEYLAECDCLVMKYIEGSSLEQVLNRRVAPLPEEKALRYLRDVCSALVYMHSSLPQPVLHRDIKPANILLDATERIWLIDFGLAKALPLAVAQAGIAHSRAAGTLGFMPPEQWQGAAEPRSDVFALMATVYVLLTFYQPDEDELSALMRGRRDTWPPIRQLNPAVSPALEVLIQRGMSNNVADRPTSQELLFELEALLDPTTIASFPASISMPIATAGLGRPAERDSVMTILPSATCSPSQGWLAWAKQHWPRCWHSASVI